jgi:predicted RNase H-like nuclease (RuvC/YqgF family)
MTLRRTTVAGTTTRDAGDVEGRLLELQEENLALKRKANEADQKLRQTTTRLARSLRSGETSAGATQVEELREQLEQSAKQNEALRRKLQLE